MEELRNRMLDVPPRWFIVLFLALIINACAFSRPLPVEQQEINPSSLLSGLTFSKVI
jgi:hypothetical protein